jgi:hypothetical protein
MDYGFNKKAASKLARQFRGETDEEDEKKQPKQQYGTWDAITGLLTPKKDEEEEKKK